MNAELFSDKSYSAFNGPSRKLFIQFSRMISMASFGYMTIEGIATDAKNVISAGCSGTDSIGDKAQVSHIDKIMVLSFTHHMANRENGQHATHDPVVITKYVDKSSPLLAQALDRREKLKCTIDFYRGTAAGQELFYSIELGDCTIADLTVDMPHAVLQNDGEPQEFLAIRYKDIRWRHHQGKTSGYALWDPQQ